MEKGEDVRGSEWFIKFTEKLIENYIKFKNCGKDREFLRGEITLTVRAGKRIKPSWVFFIKEDGEEFNLPLEDI